MKECFREISRTLGASFTEKVRDARTTIAERLNSRDQEWKTELIGTTEVLGGVFHIPPSFWSPGFRVPLIRGKKNAKHR